MRNDNIKLIKLISYLIDMNCLLYDYDDYYNKYEDSAANRLFNKSIQILHELRYSISELRGSDYICVSSILDDLNNPNSFYYNNNKNKTIKNNINLERINKNTSINGYISLLLLQKNKYFTFDQHFNCLSEIYLICTNDFPYFISRLKMYIAIIKFKRFKK